MPRGGIQGGRGKKSKKGQRRHFTDEEALKNEEEKLEREKNWRRRQGGDSDDEGGASGRKSESESSSYESSSDEDDMKKGKGVDGLIEIQNPNRAVKQSKKVTEIDSEHKTVLSRREREELEKTEAKRRYDQLHMEGKTVEAQSDLARLAIIRKQREEQAKKRELEKKDLEDKKKDKTKGLS